MSEKEYLVDGDWLSPDEFACSYCGCTIEDNGGYMAEIHGDWVCATDGDNAQCWWEVIQNYMCQVLDVDSMEKDDEVRDAQDD
tara:strand:- start:2358 stop:2606 length:249 start_codon:yes stop_codon:yes gene_type:complete